MRVLLESFLTELSDKTIKNNQYPVLTSSKDGIFLQSDYFNKQVASNDNTGYKIIRRGEFTYRAMSDTGEFFPNELECADIGIVSPAYPVFRISKPEIIKSHFLKYYFKSALFQHQIAGFAQGSTRTSVKYSKLKTVSIDLPSIKEQEKIINVLDIVNELISLRNKQMTELDNLIKARFVELFGDPATPGERYETQKLGTVSEVKSSHRVFTTEFVEDGIPFYRGTEIGVLAAGQQPENPYRITLEHYQRIASDDSKPIRGDLLLPSICNKGQVWMVDTDEPFYYKDGRVLCISPDRTVFDSRYLQFYMKMRTEAEYPKLGSGSTFAEFKIFQLKDMDVDVPPIDVQQSFSLFAEQVDKSKFGYNKIELWKINETKKKRVSRWIAMSYLR